MFKKILRFVFLMLVAVADLTYSQSSSLKLRDYLDKEIVPNFEKADLVDYKSLISCLGALAGQAVQEGLRVELIQRKNIPERKVFVVIETKSQETFYFGPFFDDFLFKSEMGTDFWSVLTKNYDQDRNKLPSVDEMAERNANLVGGREYGKHFVDSKYQPLETPISYLGKYWPSLYAELKNERLHPLSWGWEIATYTSENIINKETGIPKEVAIQIFMESAISMSKYNFKE